MDKLLRVATYQRVSTHEQTTENQVAALDGWMLSHPEATRVQAYKDEGESGANASRPAFDRMMRQAKTGMFDTLVISRLDRLGRSTEHLLKTVRQLEEAGVTLVSVRDSIDTSTASGKAFLGMLAVFSQFERDVLIERTRAGMARAKAGGKHVGRKVGSKDKKLRIRNWFRKPTPNEA